MGEETEAVAVEEALPAAEEGAPAEAPPAKAAAKAGKAVGKANAKAKKEKKPTKAKTAPSHPTYSVMITAAVGALKDRTGSSRQAILKYICANYKVDDKKAATQTRLALKRMTAGGELRMAKDKGKGAGCYKLASDRVDKPAPAKKPAAAKKVKKPAAAAKKAKVTKPKSAAKLKPAAKKSAAKKAGAKKPAAKKTGKKGKK